MRANQKMEGAHPPSDEYCLGSDWNFGCYCRHRSEVFVSHPKNQIQFCERIRHTEEKSWFVLRNSVFKKSADNASDLSIRVWNAKEGFATHNFRGHEQLITYHWILSENVLFWIFLVILHSTQTFLISILESEI